MCTGQGILLLFLSHFLPLRQNSSRGKCQLSDVKQTREDPRAEYSEGGDVYHTAITSTALVYRTVELVDETTHQDASCTFMILHSVPPERSQVPP